jgi:hypothetical protein
LSTTSTPDAFLRCFLSTLLCEVQVSQPWPGLRQSPAAARLALSKHQILILAGGQQTCRGDAICLAAQAICKPRVHVLGCCRFLPQQPRSRHPEVRQQAIVSCSTPSNDDWYRAQPTATLQVQVCVCVCVCVCGQSSKHTASDTLTPHMSGGFTVSKKLRKL